MAKLFRGLLVAGAVWIFMSGATAVAAPCLMVTLTGTQSGPVLSGGRAGSGTLVRYGDDSNNCGAISLQFDAGRGTLLRLSQAGVQPAQLNAVFFTHMHSDHAEGFPEMMQLLWNYDSKAPKLDLVCSNDAKSPAGHVMSCRRFAAHIGDPLIQSGEIAQRIAEDKERLPGGPADLVNLKPFDPSEEPKIVWELGEVKVRAIRSAHIPGHASYRVDTPAGSVVIGGDAASDTAAPPRASSTSAQVERLAAGADVIVHSTMHPVMAPGKGSDMPARVYHRQAETGDLGAMAQRAGAKHLMLTHLAPSLGAAMHGPYRIPGGPLTEVDYRRAVEASGYRGNVIVGTDLATLRLPFK